MPYRKDARRAQVQTLFEGGWTDPRKIQELMARDGTTPPHLLTIRRWLDPDLDERMRKASRNSQRRKRARQRVDLDRLTEAEMWELALYVTTDRNTNR